MLIIPALLLGVVVALVRRSSNAVVERPPIDTPQRLMLWAAGLLSEPRREWGQAMLGELDHIEGRGQRWRFTIGCVGAALLLPPWGRAGAWVWAIVALAMGSLGVYAFAIVRYGLGAGSWIGAAIALTIVAGFVFAALALLRRPGIAVPGLLGGLFVALAWLAISGFTFVDFLTRVSRIWAIPLLWIVVPAVVGVAGTLLGGSAAAGRRTARLAGISAGLGVYLYGTLAVAVLGAGGPPDDSGSSVSYIVGDRLGNNVGFYLMLLPLVTATFGWAAAAATTYIRPQLANANFAPFAAAAGVEPIAWTTTGQAVGSVLAVAGRRRRGRVVLQYAIAVAMVLLFAATWLSG